MATLKRKLIIIGAGELSNYLIHQGKSIYKEIIAITKTTGRHEKLETLGALPTTSYPTNFSDADDVVFSVPGSLNQEETLRNLKVSSLPRRAVLISSVGFYGTPSGVVTEVTPKGETPHADQIKATEAEFLKVFSERLVILRSGGLYSEFKGPFVAYMKKKSTSISPPNRTLTLIHYSDLATAILKVFSHNDPDGLYNAVTWPSPTREEFYIKAAKKLKLSPPIFSKPLNHPPAIYDTTNLRKDLEFTPQYPDWKSIFN